MSFINIFGEENFNKLYILDLSNNEISDINIFEKINFEKLNELNLSNNEIKIEDNNSLINILKSKIKDLKIKV